MGGMNNQMSPGYTKLIAWQKADQLVLLIYQITTLFPKQELFALTAQLRRAALSVPTNIVEGYARNSKAEFKRFVVIALGSLAEVRYLLSVAQRLNYIKEQDYGAVQQVCESTGQLLWKLCRSF